MMLVRGRPSSNPAGSMYADGTTTGLSVQILQAVFQ